MPAQAPLRIAAIFATMNRAETAVSCLGALKRQSRPPDLVVVADNVSSDGTAEKLRALQGLPFELIVLSMEANVGNAGGIERAIAIAFSRNADGVWILDDDSWPRPEALEHLLGEDWNPGVIRHSLQVDPRTGRFTWPLPVRTQAGDWELVWTRQKMPRLSYGPSKAAWTGALVSREVYEAVGSVNGDLFIRGEDEEYPRRIEKKGFPFEWAAGSILDHPGPPKVIHWRLLGKNLFLEPGLADWKLYYKVRNMVWLKRQEGGGLGALSMAIAYIAGIMLIDGPSRLRVLGRAISDGWRGKLGPRFLP